MPGRAKGHRLLRNSAMPLPDLIEIVPKKDWIVFSHLLIYHGRKTCKARNPQCAECVVEKECPSSFLKTGVMPGM